MNIRYNQNIKNFFLLKNITFSILFLSMGLFNTNYSYAEMNRIENVPAPWIQKESPKSSNVLYFEYKSRNKKEIELKVFLEGHLTEEQSVVDYSEKLKKDRFSKIEGYEFIGEKDLSIRGYDLRIVSFQSLVDGEKKRTEAYISFSNEIGYIFLFNIYGSQTKTLLSHSQSPATYPELTFRLEVGACKSPIDHKQTTGEIRAVSVA